MNGGIALPTVDTKGHSGSEWLAKNRRWIPGARGVKGGYQSITVSPFGALVADILGAVFLGIYHIDSAVLAPKVNWASDDAIQIHLDQELATIDYNYLSQLTALCQATDVRLSIRPAMRQLLVQFTSSQRYFGRSGTPHEWAQWASARVQQPAGAA